MEMYIGKAFEELDSEEMMTVQGGGVVTVMTLLCTFSSVPCILGTAAISIVVSITMIV